MGQSLNHIDVLEPMLLPCVANQSSVQCVGAVALWFDDAAVVLRSALRYGKQGRGGFLDQQSADPTVTLCSHEEAQWLMQAIGVGWQRLPGCGRQVINTHLASHVLHMEFDTGQPLRIMYREDLDGTWVVGGDGSAPVVTATTLTTLDGMFGWLLPKAPYPVLLHGQRWQDLATLWACTDKRTPVEDRDHHFQRLFCLRLMQHPNLHRRFAALRYPVRCEHDPWLAQRIASIHLVTCQ